MTTQTRAAQLGQMLLFGLGAGLGTGALCVLIGALLAGGLTRAGAATALGWGGLILTFLAGAIISSQNGQSQSESNMRARTALGADPHRPDRRRGAVPRAVRVDPLIGRRRPRRSAPFVGWSAGVCAWHAGVWTSR
ncbi:hypothetical protein [Deinococcus sedimenti]|uniref:Uncharacterized protein n=1 Tax=Deinococcus sedimenti TaxID=1867090 RepID=A0ABQ2S1H3_9DEIO|nr:hypothetical protein [Deinococcus sedimenti]GGR88961.1 hypothetical protein GCM10008960_14990 [Deinococcus sedimenti]